MRVWQASRQVGSVIWCLVLVISQSCASYEKTSGKSETLIYLREGLPHIAISRCDIDLTKEGPVAYNSTLGAFALLQFCREEVGEDTVELSVFHSDTGEFEYFGNPCLRFNEYEDSRISQRLSVISHPFYINDQKIAVVCDASAGMRPSEIPDTKNRYFVAVTDLIGDAVGSVEYSTIPSAEATFSGLTVVDVSAAGVVSGYLQKTLPDGTSVSQRARVEIRMPVSEVDLFDRFDEQIYKACSKVAEFEAEKCLISPRSYFAESEWLYTWVQIGNSNEDKVSAYYTEDQRYDMFLDSGGDGERVRTPAVFFEVVLAGDNPDAPTVWSRVRTRSAARVYDAKYSALMTVHDQVVEVVLPAEGRVLSVKRSQGGDGASKSVNDGALIADGSALLLYLHPGEVIALEVTGENEITFDQAFWRSSFRSGRGPVRVAADESGRIFILKQSEIIYLGTIRER